MFRVSIEETKHVFVISSRVFPSPAWASLLSQSLTPRALPPTAPGLPPPETDHVESAKNVSHMRQIIGQVMGQIVGEIRFPFCDLDILEQIDP